MKKTLSLSLLLLGWAGIGSPAYGEQIPRDTLQADRSYPIGEVVVTGSRQETDLRHLSQTVSVVDRPQIESSLQPSLLPVLTERIPACSSLRAV